MQQGPSHPKNGHLRRGALPQRQIHLHDARRASHGAFHHLQEGHHHRVRSHELPPVSEGEIWGWLGVILTCCVAEMEQRSGSHEQPMQRTGPEEMLQGSLRATGAASKNLDGEGLEVPGSSLERLGPPPPGLHQQRNQLEQVSILLFFLRHPKTDFALTTEWSVPRTK